MRFSLKAAAAAACCASVHAFSDSAPFVLFSTSELAQPSTQAQLQSSSQIMASAQDMLSSCPTDRYLIVTQPNLNAAHLASTKSAPQLRHSLENSKSSVAVSEVVGELDLDKLSNYIRTVCDKPAAIVANLNLSPLDARGDSKTLQANDREFASALDQYDSGESLTVIYTSGPRTADSETYKAEFAGSMNTELKRQLHHSGKRAIDEDFKRLPLFQKYQYFTPGIFMAIVVTIILLSILYAGISAVSSLEVPYGAFDKDMGPSAQKKQ